MKQKIILGTVQLGIPYGINNHTGKPDRKEAFKIFDSALNAGITILDSAELYGDSLQVIGSYSENKKSNPFQTISKFVGDDQLLKNKVDKALELILSEQLYAYMFHRFADYRSGKFKHELQVLKSIGKIKRIGVSLYSMDELRMCIDDPDVDVIQLPLNPFDASVEKRDMLKTAKLLGKEIHVRSVFLQGLFFKSSDQLTGNLKSFSKPLEQFQSIIKTYQLDVRQACLNFALHIPFVDHVIIGVDTCDQLDQNIESVMETFPVQLFEEIYSIDIENDTLLNPSNWKP